MYVLPTLCFIVLESFISQHHLHEKQLVLKRRWLSYHHVKRFLKTIDTRTSQLTGQYMACTSFCCKKSTSTVDDSKAVAAYCSNSSTTAYNILLVTEIIYKKRTMNEESIIYRLYLGSCYLRSGRESFIIDCRPIVTDCCKVVVVVLLGVALC